MPEEQREEKEVTRIVYLVRFSKGRLKSVMANDHEEAALIAMQHCPDSDKVVEVRMEGVARFKFDLVVEPNWQNNVIKIGG